MSTIAKTFNYEEIFQNNAGNPKEPLKWIDGILNGENERNISIQYININNTITDDPHINNNYIICHFSNTGEELSNQLPECDTYP